MDITYFQVLFYFIFPPLILLAGFNLWELWSSYFIHKRAIEWLPYVALVTHVFLAVIYTTPWDNYLVATRVWWYDQDLVTGWIIGYVPIEEYTFFVVQTLMTGLWVLTLWRIRALELPFDVSSKLIRRWSLIITATIWMVSFVVLVSGWGAGRYLALILVWALIPMLMQFGFGADILWARRSLLILAILPTTVYLWIVDAIAIYSGVWTIDPLQTTGIKIGPLPIEEMVFFLMTNVMITFGITLMIVPESRARISQVVKWINMAFGWKRGMA